MPRFFVDDLTDEVMITGEEARHMARSLRMRVGEHVTLCDGAGTDAEAVIRAIDDRAVTLDILSRAPSRAEPRIEITLFQACPKSDKLEFIVQKATELGVLGVQPFLSRYCVSRPDDSPKKRERLQKIAAEAAKQSGRGRIPALLPLITLKEVAARLPDFDRAILCYEKAEMPLSEALADMGQVRRVAVIVGSEGGFSEEEAAALAAAGALSCLMGPRILRCETAPITALSALMLAAGEL